MLRRFGPLIAVIALAAPADGGPKPVGHKVADFTLTEPKTGQQRSLKRLAGGRGAVVAVFMGTVCPVNNQYMPRLNELARKYAGRVAFVGINANSQDSADEVAAHAKEWKLTFPVLRDENHKAADAFRAEMTPEAFLLDAAGVVRYRGRIDDQFTRRVKKLNARRHDLRDAIDSVLAGGPVANPATEVVGCHIGRRPNPKADARITYAKHVAPLMQRHCLECHRSGQIAPMALTDYESVAAWAETVREVVDEGFMPPWGASPEFGHFENERRLSAAEKATIARWVEAGCPEGDEKDLPPAKTFASGEWKVGKPDLILEMPDAEKIPADTPAGGIPYKYFIIDPGFKKDVYVQRAEARAGDPSVVHHIIAFVVPPRDRVDPRLPRFPLLPGVRHAQVLCGTAPGDLPTVLPDGTGRHIPAGSKIVLQMHYTPNGKATEDRSRVGLIFNEAKPKYNVQAVPVFNSKIRIPPRAGDHREDARFTFRRRGRVLSLMPHMHLRGKSFRMDVVSPSGGAKTALWVPRYDFNWQLSYRLKEPIDVPAGGAIHCVAKYDNSADNPHNPDPSKRVFWGDQTWQEMLIGWADVVWMDD